MKALALLPSQVGGTKAETTNLRAIRDCCGIIFSEPFIVARKTKKTSFLFSTKQNVL
jgi:hypothetical protein